MAGTDLSACLTVREQLQRSENLLYGVVNATRSLLTINDHDLAITQAISILGKVTGVDLVCVFKFMSGTDKAKTVINTCYQWFGNDNNGLNEINTAWEAPPAEDGLDTWYTVLLKGGSVRGLTRHLPIRERVLFEQQGILSFLFCPVFIRGEPWGFIGFMERHDEKTWHDNEEWVLTTAAAGIGAVMDRIKADEALSQAYEELEARVQERTSELARVNQTLHNEVIERRQMEEKLRYLGQHDALTGLYNRAFFQENMHQMEKLAHSSPGLILCDVDGLKLVNDFLGHDAGDTLLRETARLLKMCFREDDIIARIGGDEFAVLLRNANEVMVERAGRRIKDALARYNKIQQGVPLSLSVGFASRTEPDKSIDELFKEADSNMYKEKAQYNHKVRATIVKALINILQQRELFRGSFQNNMERTIGNFGIALGLPQNKLHDLILLAQFHNYGKLEIPPDLLFKGRELNPEESELLKRHCEAGQRIAQFVPELNGYAEWMLKHHEWWNGEGYPGVMQREQIPLECRILSICDAYDTMVAHHERGETAAHAKALEKIKKYSGQYFDPGIVDEFLKLKMEDY